MAGGSQHVMRLGHVIGREQWVEGGVADYPQEVLESHYAAAEIKEVNCILYSRLALRARHRSRP
jgi:hypothetical protein